MVDKINNINFSENVEPDRIMDSSEVDGILESEDSDIYDKQCITNEKIMLTSTSSPVQFGVNKSDYNINVRSNVGTSNSIVAKMYNKECFGFTGNKKTDSDGYEWHKIKIRNSSGSWISGWYRGYNGVGYWKNNPYRTGTSTERQYYLVTTKTSYYTPGGEFMDTLEPGDRVYCNTKSNSGISGSSHQDWMLFHGIHFKNGVYMSIREKSTGQDYDWISYAYVDTQIKHGDSHIKGNWA